MTILRSSEHGDIRPTTDQGGITGGIVDVLACPECGNLGVHRTYDDEDNENGWKCERGHRFEQPGLGWVQTYESDQVGKL